MSRNNKPRREHINNKVLLAEILRSQENLADIPRPEWDDKKILAALTPELIDMIYLFVTKMATSYRWRGYSWIEEMKADAVFNLARVALKFDLAKAGDHPNPFAYYTQIVKRVFISYLTKQSKQGKIRDEIIWMSNTTMMPSWSLDHENAKNSLHTDLDNTQAVKADPRKYRRRKRGKVPPEDDTTQMTENEYNKWLEKKRLIFEEKQKTPK